jgi:hypothetical protein
MIVHSICTLQKKTLKKVNTLINYMVFYCDFEITYNNIVKPY